MPQETITQEEFIRRFGRPPTGATTQGETLTRGEFKRRYGKDPISPPTGPEIAAQAQTSAAQASQIQPTDERGVPSRFNAQSPSLESWQRGYGRSQEIQPSSLGRMASEFANSLPTLAAQEIPPAVGATIGASLGSAGGPPGMALGGAIGGAGTEALMQLMRLGTGQPQVPPGSTLVAPETPAGRIMEQGLLGSVQELGSGIRTGVRAAGAAMNTPPPIPSGYFGGPMPTTSPTPGTRGWLERTAERLRQPYTSSYATPEAALLREFEIPARRATRMQLQAPFAVAFDKAVQAFPTAYPYFRAFDERVNRALGTAYERLAKQISRNRSQTSKEFGEAMQGSYRGADTAAGVQYNKALNEISAAGAREVPLDIQPLAQRAKQLLDNIELRGDYAEVFTGGKDAESLQFAIDRLKMLAKTTRTSEGVILYPSQMEKTLQEIPKTLTWEEARKLRTILFDLSNTGKSNIGKGAIKTFNETLNTQMGKALTNAGHPKLAEKFSVASSNYKRVQELLDDSLIAGMRGNATPETIVDVFLGSGSESAVEKALKLVPGKRHEMAAAIFKRAYEKSLTENIPVGNAFERTWASLPKGAKDRLFAGQRPLLQRIERFAKAIDLANLGPELASPASARRTTLIGLGTTATLFGAGAGLLLNPRAALGTVTGLASVVVTPRIVAKMMTNERATNLLIAGLKTPVTDPKSHQIATQLLTIISRMSLTPEERQEAGLPPTAEQFRSSQPRSMPTVTSPPPTALQRLLGQQRGGNQN